MAVSFRMEEEKNNNKKREETVLIQQLSLFSRQRPSRTSHMATSRPTLTAEHYGTGSQQPPDPVVPACTTAGFSTHSSP